MLSSLDRAVDSENLPRLEGRPGVEPRWRVVPTERKKAGMIISDWFVAASRRSSRTDLKSHDRQLRHTYVGTAAAAHAAT
nr:unnamed protein product [Spirometra erinaceieuropaei]